MNYRSLIQGFAGLALLCTLGGCASLSKNECLSANWEDIGIRDGANGRPEEYLIQHSTACAKVNVVPDRGAWLHGHERGRPPPRRLPREHFIQHDSQTENVCTSVDRFASGLFGRHIRRSSDANFAARVGVRHQVGWTCVGKVERSR